ncbi:MAG: hypothetical protein HZB53_10480 [Chloroflexi bacterium]|nr:hypothetical protein [Chloroflexota bacterium]
MNAARAATVALLLATIALWAAFVAFNPFDASALTPESVAVALVMAALAAAGLVAVARNRPGFLVLTSAASFLPVGLYLLGVPSVFRLIGVANLLCLLAGLGLWWRRRQIR